MLHGQWGRLLLLLLRREQGRLLLLLLLLLLLPPPLLMLLCLHLVCQSLPPPAVRRLRPLTHHCVPEGVNNPLVEYRSPYLRPQQAEICVTPADEVRAVEVPVFPLRPVPQTIFVCVRPVDGWCEEGRRRLPHATQDAPERNQLETQLGPEGAVLAWVEKRGERKLL